MKSYSWSTYSKQYCTNIILIDNSKNNQFCLYEAFNNAEWTRMFYVVYKDKVVMEYINLNEAVSKFYAMIDLLKHLGEEGELKE